MILKIIKVRGQKQIDSHYYHLADSQFKNQLILAIFLNSQNKRIQYFANSFVMNELHFDIWI
jgi:hypothetical protein